MKKVLKCVLITASLMLTACSSMRLEDFFTGYGEQMVAVRQAHLQGNFTQALSLLPRYSEYHNSYNLSLLEQGRLAFLQNNWPLSQQYYEQAYQQIEQQQAKAKLQISRGLQNVGSLVSNDSAIGYIVPAYEQSMLHSYQALNFVFQQDLEAALVEVRRANLVQKNALKENEEALLEAKDNLAESGVSISDIYSAYPSMDDSIGEIKNGFQNAFTFYLSALLYQASGEWDSAYIDYKRAIDIFPENSYLQQDVMRLAKQTNRSDELKQFEQRFSGVKSVQQENIGDIVVIFEQKLINAKQEQRVNLPIFTRHGDMRFFSLALPVYQSLSRHNKPLLIVSDDKRFVSEDIVRLQSLASKTLKDQVPALVSRQAVRLIAKEQLRRKMKSEAGDLGNILSGLYNLASEKADTRSWLTLPSNIQIARFPQSSGQKTMSFSYNGQTITETIPVKEGRTTLVKVTGVGQFFGVKSIIL